MRAPFFNVGDAVLFYGETGTVEEIEPRTSRNGYDYFIRTETGHTWANESELEPCELNYEGRDD